MARKWDNYSRRLSFDVYGRIARMQLSQQPDIRISLRHYNPKRKAYNQLKQAVTGWIQSHCPILRAGNSIPTMHLSV